MVFRAYRLTPAVQRNEAGVPLTKEQLLACQSIWDHADLESRTLSAREISESLDSELCDDDWQEEDFEDQESSSDSEGKDEDRLLFLEYAIPEKGYASLIIPARGDRDRLTRLQNVRKEYMVCGAESPFEELFSLLCYGKKIAANSTPPFFLHWSDDAETVTVSDECSITMEDFKRLRALSPRRSRCPEELVPGPPGPEVRWRSKAIALYEATVDSFLTALASPFHMANGQPLRESELFSITWRNTQRHRSIGLKHGRVMVHVTYHKGQQQTGRYKDNIRFLHPAMGDMLIDYIVYVLPLRLAFARHSSPKAVMSPYLWE
ncbi:hypothetical protein PLIIFM63780_010637 [Purpureocillium lilacinum]|nr:hypothetical protein PLIIFM63780_010637 [Purpureocillium lilacinum]